MMHSTAGIPVAVSSPLSRIDLSHLPLTPDQAADVDCVVAAPIGLALPDLGGRSFNLLPDSARTRAIEKRVHRYLVRGAAAVAILMVLLTGLRFFQVHSAQSHLSSIQAENATIQNVQIPKYDKALDLRNQAVKQSAQVLPILDKEVDWLVVLNQISQYIPSAATLSNISLAAASSPGAIATPSTIKGASLGTITTTVVAKALTDVTTWGQSMAQSPIFNNVDLTSGVSHGTSTNFSATLNILNGARTQRIAEFSVPTK
jgi:Tfp pilus assembly protein PilN